MLFSKDTHNSLSCVLLLKCVSQPGFCQKSRFTFIFAHAILLLRWTENGGLSWYESATFPPEKVKIIGKIPVFGKPIVKIVQRLKRSVKQLIIPKMFFEDIGFTYLGPVDGHNIEELEKIL